MSLSQWGELWRGASLKKTLGVLVIKIGFHVDGLNSEVVRQKTRVVCPTHPHHHFNHWSSISDQAAENV